jgi:hypothetical protein
MQLRICHVPTLEGKKESVLVNRSGVRELSCMGQMGNAYKVLIEKPKEKRITARLKHRWEI